MSVATEIQRLQQAKADIKSAIKNKGVTVGDGTIDTYAKFIDEIVSSGGGKNYAEGTITFTDADVESRLQIEHNMGVVPTLFMLLPDYEIDYTINAANAAILVRNEVIDNFAVNIGATKFNMVFETRTTYGSYGTWIAFTNVEFDDTTVTFSYRSNAYRYRAGVPYKWIAVTIQLDNTSVVDNLRYVKQCSFPSLNVFGKAEVELNFDNMLGFTNLFQITDKVYANTTVEHLTINCPNYVSSIQQILYCHSSASDYTLKRVTLNFDTQNCTNFANAFTCQRALEVIDGQPLNYSAVTNANYMNGFSNCGALVEVRFVANSIKLSISLSSSPLLSTDTIQSIIDGLADLTPRYYAALQTGPDTYEKGELIENVISATEHGTDANGETLYNVEYGTAPPNIFSALAYKEGGGDAQTLTLHAGVKAKLTDEQKATITNKNWLLA